MKDDEWDVDSTVKGKVHIFHKKLYLCTSFH